MAILKNHIQVTLNELERNLSMFKLEDYIAACEDVIEKSIEDIAQRIADNPETSAIFISGPSGSGKTTFNFKLAKWLQKKNIISVNVSLDDYYLDHEFQTDEFGRYDYESISTLDIDLITQDLQNLIAGRKVNIPTFDFPTKSRVAHKAKPTILTENAVLLVEGLHGLADEISGVISPGKWLGIFLMPYATLTDDYTLLNSRDLRILRRAIRDVNERGTNVLSTIDYWPMLDKAELTNFPPYLENADIYINTAMPYEFYCLAPIIKKMLEKSLDEYTEGSIYDSNLTSHIGLAQPKLALQTAERLLKATKKIPGISASLVPKDSILNEFVKN